jgi:hypothetical protein
MKHHKNKNKVKAHVLTHNIFEVGGHVGAP